MGEHHRIAIVGSGFAGLGTAVRLKQAGIEDFVVLERDSEIGGTWWANTYPGCQCDIPSHLYSFSFAPNPEWSRTYSLQPEILDYLRRVSSERGIGAHIRFGHEVVAARWDEDAKLWQVETSVTGTHENGSAAQQNGSAPCATLTLTAELLIVGPGPLSHPEAAEHRGNRELPGRDLHSARWDHEHSLHGKRIAVIGTGASSIQFVPKIQPKVSKLHVFQRTPPWIIPHGDRPTTRIERALYRVFPPAQRLARAFTYWSRELFVFTLMKPRAGAMAERIGRRHLREQVPDPELRAKLAPRYRIGCKRTLLSNDYYPAIQEPNVELVTESIETITPRAIRTADGAERTVDTIILGTGFHVDRHARRRVGDRTRRAHARRDLAGQPPCVSRHDDRRLSQPVYAGWPQHRARSQLARVHDRVSAQLRNGLHRPARPRRRAHVRAARRRAAALQRGPAAQARGQRLDLGRMRELVSGRARRNSTIWPGFTWPFRRRTRRFDPADYELHPRTTAPAAPVPAAAPAPAPAHRRLRPRRPRHERSDRPSARCAKPDHHPTRRPVS